MDMIHGVGVVGGLLRKPMFVPVERIAGEPFVKLSKREGWLCHAVCGKAAGLNPLGRTTALDTLAAQVTKVAGEARDTAPAEQEFDAMAGLGLDDDVAPVAPRKKKNKTGDTKETLPPKVVELELPPRLRANGVERVKCAAHVRHSRNNLMLHLDHLDWAINLLAHEVESGGVDFELDAPALAEPFWACRDRAWVARARTPSGNLLRKSIAIPVFTPTAAGKRTLTSEEFHGMKRLKLVEIKEWQVAVNQGSVDRAGRGRPWPEAS